MYESDYAVSLDVIAPGITEQITQVQQPGESWVDSLARLLPILATTYQQKQLLEVQMQRARAGQAPLDVSQYAPGVRVGMTEDTKTLLIVGGIVAAMLVGFALYNKR